MSRTPASLKVFVIENHEDTLHYLSRYLQQCGHSVRSATTATEALRLLGDEPADVLLSDIGLPDGDGWTLMRSLHTRPFAIAMSGYGTAQDLERSRAAGFSHHLIKPFDPEELDRILADAARALSRDSVADGVG